MTHSISDFLSAPEGRDFASKFLASFPRHHLCTLYLSALFHRHAPSVVARPPLFSYRPRHSCSLFVACHSRFLRITPRSCGTLTLAAEGIVERNERRTSKLILNAEVGHLVYFFINFAEWAIRLPRRILIKGPISHPSCFIPPRLFSISYSNIGSGSARILSVTFKRSRRKWQTSFTFSRDATYARNGWSYLFEDWWRARVLWKDL